MNGNDYLKQIIQKSQSGSQNKKSYDPMALFKTLAIIAGILVILFLAAESGRFGW